MASPPANQQSPGHVGEHPAETARKERSTHLYIIQEAPRLHTLSLASVTVHQLQLRHARHPGTSHAFRARQSGSSLGAVQPSRLTASEMPLVLIECAASHSVQTGAVAVLRCERQSLFGGAEPALAVDSTAADVVHTACLVPPSSCKLVDMNARETCLSLMSGSAKVAASRSYGSDAMGTGTISTGTKRKQAESEISKALIWCS